jgi:hypothetical protein
LTRWANGWPVTGWVRSSWCSYDPRVRQRVEKMIASIKLRRKRKFPNDPEEG